VANYCSHVTTLEFINSISSNIIESIRPRADE